MNKEKIREKRIFEIVHCPFEGQADMHHSIQPDWPVRGASQVAARKANVQFQKSIFLDFA